MAKDEKIIRYPLFRKIALGVVWYLIMYVGVHTLTNFYVGFRAGMHAENPEAGGRAGLVAAERVNDKYGPTMVAIAFGLTMAGLRNGMFVARRLRGEKERYK